MKNQGTKVAFGIIIFLFSVALAYFTAWYFEGQSGGTVGRHAFRGPFMGYPYGQNTPGIEAFWITLLIFGGAYILIGILVARIFPVSLGFLFSADVVLLHALNDQYHGLNNGIKSLLIFVLLIALYTFAYLKLKNKESVPRPVIPGQS